MSSIEERQREIVEEFALFPDWMGRYEYLIELGQELPPYPDALRDENHRVRGCQAQVWLRSELRDGRIFYTADSDALITKGLIALLTRVLSGQPAQAVAHANLDFLEKIGMKEHLSPTRKNGLAAMIEKMKLQAVALN